MEIKHTPADPDSAHADWQGALEGQMDGFVYGWASHRSAPEARAVVEILLGNTVVTAVIADIFRADLADQQRDGCHGFAADLRSYVELRHGTITARIANTATYLPGSVQLASASPPSAAVRYVYGDGGLLLTGAALDPINPGNVLTVFAYAGEQKIAQAEASLSLPFHRGEAMEGHGFELKLPASLGDGQLRKIHIADSTGTPLSGSPVAVCCHVEGGASLAKQAGTANSTALSALIEQYEQLLPSALGMEHFSAWHSHFEQGQPAATTAARRCAIVIHGDSAPANLPQVLPGKTGPDIFLCQNEQELSAVIARILASPAEILVFLRAGDELAANALSVFATALKPGVDLVYADSLDLSNTDPLPWFKPAWNPTYAWTSDYFMEGCAITAAAFRRATQAPNQAKTVPQILWNLLAEIMRMPDAGDSRILHIPQLLYHFRTPLTSNERSARQHAARAALQQICPTAQLEELKLPSAQPADHTPRRCRYPLPTQAPPKVSLIIPTRDQAEMVERCIDSIRRHTRWPKLEIILIDNQSSQPESHALFRRLKKSGIRVYSDPAPFNYARINNQAVAKASGSIVGLINNDIEAIHDHWLEEMLSHLLRPGIGAVGAKLLWPNHMVQHGGVILGLGHAAGHFGQWLDDTDPGDHSRNQVAHELSAVTAACLLLHKQDFLDVGGLDERSYPVNFNDVDLCLKLRALGKRIVWTPHARLLHLESASRGKEDTPQKKARAARELSLLRQHWGNALARDPAYHPCLSLSPRTQPFNSLAIPPRSREPRSGKLQK